MGELYYEGSIWSEAKSTIGKRDLKEEHLDTKYGKYLQLLRVNSGEEKMRKEERGHELSENKKKNRWENVLVINNGKHHRSKNGRRFGWEILGMRGRKKSLKERFMGRGE